MCVFLSLSFNSANCSDSRHYLTETHWSPDGRVFAVSSMDHKVYLYRSDSYKLQGICDKHNAAVKNFDFSENSLYLQSDSQEDYEHLYFDVSDGQHYTAGSQLRDVRWQSWTCIFGWPVQGIWPVYHPDDEKSLLEDGNSKDPSCLHRMPAVRGGLAGQDHLVYGDRSGNVTLTRFPCLSKGATRFSEPGHVGSVRKIRYSADGRYVVSIGEKDRTVMIWAVTQRLSSGEFASSVPLRPGTSGRPSSAEGGMDDTMGNSGMLPIMNGTMTTTASATGSVHGASQSITGSRR